MLFALLFYSGTLAEVDRTLSAAFFNDAEARSCHTISVT